MKIPLIGQPILHATYKNLPTRKLKTKKEVRKGSRKTSTKEQSRQTFLFPLPLARRRHSLPLSVLAFLRQHSFSSRKGMFDSERFSNSTSILHPTLPKQDYVLHSFFFLSEKMSILIILFFILYNPWFQLFFNFFPCTVCCPSKLSL